MTVIQYITYAITICTFIGILVGGTKFVVVPILDMQKNILKIEIILNASIKSNDTNTECIEEIKTLVEEHESRLIVFEEKMKIYHK